MMDTIATFFSNLTPHMPVLAIMTMFTGAFFIALIGERLAILRRIIVCVSVFVPLFFMLYLIRPVMLEGEILSYWMGNWEPVAGYAVGIGLEVDALSLFFALIVTVMATMSALYSFRYTSRDDAHEKYDTLFLMLCGSVLGLVLTGDLFNMYVMIEIMTFSAVALTAFRNWYHGALEAAFKYLVVSCIGSTCILIGTTLLYAQHHTLNLAQLSAVVGQPFTPAELLCLAFLIAGFAVKAFATPFHTIAADAHATAPSSISVMISGVLTKAGVYGLIRVGFFLFQCMDSGAMRTLVLLFGCLSMVVCVSMALLQHDFKRLLAYHSISQIGYVLTAIGLSTALGVAGGLYHALNHSLFKGLLFLCAGCVLYRTGKTDLDSLGGLSRKMPHTCLLFLVAAASIRRASAVQRVRVQMDDLSGDLPGCGRKRQSRLSSGARVRAHRQRHDARLVCESGAVCLLRPAAACAGTTCAKRRFPCAFRWRSSRFCVSSRGFSPILSAAFFSFPRRVPSITSAGISTR